MGGGSHIRVYKPEKAEKLVNLILEREPRYVPAIVNLLERIRCENEDVEQVAFIDRILEELRKFYFLW